MSHVSEQKKRVNWTWAEENVMLNIFKEKNIHAKLDGREVRSDVCYTEVSEEMATKGFYRTASQIRIKYYALRSTFREFKNKHAVSGAGYESIPHATILYDLFGHRPAAKLIDAGVDTSRNPAMADTINDEEPTEAIDEERYWGTVGLSGVITLDNPADCNNPIAPIDLPLVHQLTDQPTPEPFVVQREPDCQPPAMRQHPIDRQPVAQREPADHLANPNRDRIRQDNQEAGDIAGEIDGVARHQIPGPGQQRAFHGVRRGAGRLQDRNKGKGSYAKALTNFHEQWSNSQRELQEQMVERHETFVRLELEASRQWEAQQQNLHQQHTRELIESSNTALTTAMDKLLGAFNKPPQQLQIYQPNSYPAGFPQPPYPFTYPVNVHTPNPSPTSSTQKSSSPAETLYISSPSSSFDISPPR